MFKGTDANIITEEAQKMSGKNYWVGYANATNMNRLSR